MQFLFIYSLSFVFILFQRTVLNVAAGKAPMQISTEGSGIPQKAIDGSTSAFYTADTCSLTKSERVPWWYVNLLEPYMVQLVRLDFGKACCGKLLMSIPFNLWREFIVMYSHDSQRSLQLQRDNLFFRSTLFNRIINDKTSIYWSN